jgi:hypothetical protein
MLVAMAFVEAKDSSNAHSNSISVAGLVALTSDDSPIALREWELEILADFMEIVRNCLAFRIALH